MKLVQLNMWWGGKLSNNILSFLKDTKPDIICLQEAVSFNKDDPGLFLSTEIIQKLNNLPYAASAPAFSFKLMEGVASFGNCIISRLPFLTSEVIYTNLEHKENFDFNNHDYNVRNLLHCTIKHSGRVFHVLTHHGHHIPSHKNGDTQTLRQAKMIGEYIDKLEGPIILAGDFNLSPKSKSLEQINKRLTNLPIKHNLKTTRTKLTRKPGVCDYIFVNEDLKVIDFYASDKVISDHKALVLDFKL